MRQGLASWISCYGSTISIIDLKMELQHVESHIDDQELRLLTIFDKKSDTEVVNVKAAFYTVLIIMQEELFERATKAQEDEPNSDGQWYVIEEIELISAGGAAKQHKPMLDVRDKLINNIPF